MEEAFNSLLRQVKEQAPWVVGLAIKPSESGKYLRIAADSIFRCSHVQEPEKWSSCLVSSFRPKYNKLLQTVVESSGYITTIQSNILLS